MLKRHLNWFEASDNKTCFVIWKLKAVLCELPVTKVDTINVWYCAVPFICAHDIDGQMDESSPHKHILWQWNNSSCVFSLSGSRDVVMWACCYSSSWLIAFCLVDAIRTKRSSFCAPRSNVSASNEDKKEVERKMKNKELDMPGVCGFAHIQ